MSSNTPDGARQRANTDFNRGNAPAATHTWDSHSRDTYNAEFQRRQQEQQDKSRSGY